MLMDQHALTVPHRLHGEVVSLVLPVGVVSRDVDTYRRGLVVFSARPAAGWWADYRWA